MTSKRSAIRALLCGIALVGVVAGSGERARAASTGAEFGLGVASVFCNLLYSPAKLFYAGMGGMVGGMAWMFSGGDNEVALPIWDASLRGTYALTDEHFRDPQKIEFIGRSQEQERARQAANETGPYSDGF